MNDSTGSNGDIVSNSGGEISLNLGNVDDSAFSNGSIFSNSNLINITANYSTVPDTYYEVGMVRLECRN